MQDGKHPRTGVKLFIFSWIFESQDTRENGWFQPLAATSHAGAATERNSITLLWAGS